MEIVSKPKHRESIVVKAESGYIPTQAFQDYLDDIELRFNNHLLGNSVKLPSYTVTTLPTASENTGSIVYVSNETGGAVTAFSDGSAWRRTTDRAIVS